MIGAALKQLRIDKGLTQEQMVHGIISESSYSKIERGIHDIDAQTLIDILTANGFDVVDFLKEIGNQPIEKSPEIELYRQIDEAENQNNLKELDQLVEKIENYKGKSSFSLQLKLERAYVSITHSNKHISSKFKKKVKSVLMKEDWTEFSYHYLSEAIIFLNVEDAYYVMNSAWRAYEKNPEWGIFTIQFLGRATINFLNLCYRQKGKKKYVDQAVEFLQNSLPQDSTAGMNNILATYYEALFDGDEEMCNMIIKILDKSGYLFLIQDTLASNQDNIRKQG